MPRAFLPALLLALTACAHGALFPSAVDEAGAATPSAPAPPPAPAPAVPPAPPPESPLIALRAEVDRYLEAQGELLWQAWTSGAAPDLQATAAAHERLFSAETVRLVREARDRAAGDERRALSLLHAFLLGEHLARETQLDAAATGPVAWDGGTVPAWRVPALLAAEAAPARRAALERAWAAAERRGGRDVDARWAAVQAAAARLGYPSLPALATELRGDSLESLAALAGNVLEATAPAYQALLTAVARVETGRPAAELRGRDLPRVLRGGEDARAFPAVRAADQARAVLPGAGIDLAARPGLVVDDAARPGKDPRALALPVRVPGSVRLSYVPADGSGALRGLLHELGATAYYAHVTAPQVEFRRLGNVTSEVWADLLEDLAGDPAWLAERTGLDDHRLAPLARAALVRRLHRVRTLAARILIEAARARDPAGAPAAARALLERTLLHPVEADELELFLLDRDPLLESADALRALLLGAQARAFLDARSPPAWWRSKESGPALAAAFSHGSRLAPAELARALGADALDATALVAVTRARAEATGVRIP